MPIRTTDVPTMIITTDSPVTENDLVVVVSARIVEINGASFRVVVARLRGIRSQCRITVSKRARWIIIVAESVKR